MTELFLQVVKDHVKANKEHREFLMDSQVVTDETVQMIKQLNGQIYCLKEILDIKTFMKDDLEELDDERKDSRAPGAFEDGSN